MISLKRLAEIFSYTASLLQFLPKFNGEVVWSLLIDVYAERKCSTTWPILRHEMEGYHSDWVKY